VAIFHSYWVPGFISLHCCFVVADQRLPCRTARQDYFRDFICPFIRASPELRRLRVNLGSLGQFRQIRGAVGPGLNNILYGIVGMGHEHGCVSDVKILCEDVSCGPMWALHDSPIGIASPCFNCKHDQILDLWVLESWSLICVFLFRGFYIHNIHSINIADINWPADVNGIVADIRSSLLVLARWRRIIWVISPEFGDQFVHQFQYLLIGLFQPALWPFHHPPRGGLEKSSKPVLGVPAGNKEYLLFACFL